MTEPDFRVFEKKKIKNRSSIFHFFTSFAEEFYKIFLDYFFNEDYSSITTVSGIYPVV